MFANGFRKIYSYHLKKCGGTSLNGWIARHVDDFRLWDEHRFFSQLRDEWGFRLERAHAASAAFVACDAVFTHVPLVGMVPPDTFCMVVLRDPISRLLSQVADWRRDALHAEHDAPEDVLTAMRDALELPLADFLARYATGPRAYLFDNYQTRALANRLPQRDETVTASPTHLLSSALRSLQSDYHLVGTTEQMRFVRLAMASMLGLPYDETRGARLNVTGSGEAMQDEVAGAQDVLEHLTRTDRLLYAEAVRLFEQRHLADAEAYSTAVFERDHALAATARQRPSITKYGAMVSVREPLLAAGIHGRDASGRADCTVWTGPSTRSTFYICTPIGAEVHLQLWLRGLAAPDMLERMQLRIDGQASSFSLHQEAGWAALLSTPKVKCGAYAKIEIEVERTVADSALIEDQDLRERGIAIGAIGWAFDFPWLAD